MSVRLKRIQRQFLLGGSDHDKKISLVRWAAVCTDKRKGGIRIKSFSNMNKALLSKWSWRFANDRKSLWRKVVNLANHLEAGIPAISEADMELVYGRRSGKSGPVFSRTWSSP